MGKLKVFTAFSGYDSQCMALDKLGIEYELVGWSEIDKYAIRAHNAVYPQWAERNFGDISKIEWCNVPDFDLFTYSFPCQDISNAGVQKGLEEGSGTRSSLLWECQKTIEVKKPKYLLMENVKNLTSKKFLPFLKKWDMFLQSMGYTNHTKVLNARNYGIPQNRERVFMVSILGGGKNEWFEFPEPFELDVRLKDILEEDVDESFYLSDKQIKQIIDHCNRKVAEGCGFKPAFKTNNEICTTISTKYGSRQTDTYLIEEPKIIQKYGDRGTNQYSVRNIAHTIPANPMSDRGQMLIIPQATKKGYIEIPPESVFDGSYPESKTRRGRLQDGGKICPTLTANGNTPLYYGKSKTNIGISINPKGRKMEFRGFESVKNDVCPCLTATNYKRPHVLWDFSDCRIRKLTPKECLRLMGVSDDNIDKIQKEGISKSQQYKLAGNSIVTNVLFCILKKLFIDKNVSNRQLTLF